MDLAEANHATNQELEERVTAFLHSRQRPPLQRISVNATSGTVILQGKVGSFYERQLCIECCRRVPGVMKLVDLIEVIDPDVR